MSRGYVKLWRKSTESAVWNLSPLTWRVWCYILMRASHAHHKVAVPGGEVLLHPGEMVTSYNDLAEGVAWWENKREVRPTPRQMRSSLNVMEMLGLVERRQEPGQKYLHLNVAHWAAYQGAAPTTASVTESVAKSVPGQYQVRRVDSTESVTASDAIDPHVAEMVKVYLDCHDKLARTRPTARGMAIFTEVVAELLANGANVNLLRQAVEQIVTDAKSPSLLALKLGDLEKARRGTLPTPGGNGRRHFTPEEEARIKAALICFAQGNDNEAMDACQGDLILWGEVVHRGSTVA